MAAKVPRIVHDPLGTLREEAEKHTKAWTDLNHVIIPFGFLAADDYTGTPAALVMEIAT